MKGIYAILFGIMMCASVYADTVSDLRPAIKAAAEENGVDPVLIEAIIRHESGHAKSHAARHKNNLAGIMGRRGQRKYETKEECVADLGRILGKYKARGRVTTAQIGRVYCTVGGWARQVNAHMAAIRSGRYGTLEAYGEQAAQPAQEGK
ncbi:MAG: glucosaminidase domain-containing protein [Akkermansia sp.]|nr:glucosaminidase domain-containing protein [Akkermansia sp.]